MITGEDYDRLERAERRAMFAVVFSVFAVVLSICVIVGNAMGIW